MKTLTTLIASIVAAAVLAGTAQARVAPSKADTPAKAAQLALAQEAIPETDALRLPADDTQPPAKAATPTKTAGLACSIGVYIFTLGYGTRINYHYCMRN